MKKRVIKLTESQLRSIVNKTVMEQRGHHYTGSMDEQEQLGNEQGTEDQYMTGPDAGDVSGGQDEGEVNYDAFITATQELMGQGVTIGDLVDKMCEAKDANPGQEGEGGEEELPPTDDFQLTR
jgi:hypothetical protein